jgi:hypothetical protein
MTVYSGIVEGPKLAAAIPAVTARQLVRDQARRSGHCARWTHADE